MKNNYATLKAIMLLLFFSFYGHVSFSQVFLSYAENAEKIYRTNDSNFTITGKRITVSDSDHYAVGYEPYTRLGTGIFLNNCKNVVISNCIIGPTGGKGIYLQACDSVTITNCIFLDNTAAIITWGSSKIKIVNNQFINVQNLRRGDPCLGRDLVYPYNMPAQPANGREGGFVQLRLSGGAGTEIKDNVGENIMGHSCPEDMINVSHSAFDAGRPLIISGNKFRGGGPSPSGGGIMLADDVGGLSYPVTSNIIETNNKLVDPGQYGIAVSGGTNIIIDGNQVYGKSQRFNNVGMLAGDGYRLGVCANIQITNNKINYIGRWPLGSDTAYPSYFYLPDAPDNCGISSGGRDSIWYYNNNDFGTSIDSSILPERLLAPFPVAYLKFDNNLNDYSGAGLNATTFGSASVVCDVYRKAANFGGGSDYLELPKSVWLKPSTQMISVSAWIKPNALSNIQGFIRSQDAGGWDDGWRGILGYSYFTPMVVTENGRGSVDCDGVSAGAWNHVVFTYDGKTLKGYVNGILKNSTAWTGSIIYNTDSHLAIGGSEGTYNFDGMIAEVTIYNGILNGTEISNEYSSKIGFFNGTATNSSMDIQAEYFANGQSKYLNSYSGVYPNSSGTINGSATGGSSYQWQLLSGSPTYAYFYGQTAYISIPGSGYASLRLTVNASCALPGVRDFFIYANYSEPFKIKLIPGVNDIVVSKPTAEEGPLNGNTNRLIPGVKNQPSLYKGTYTVQVVNMLGQVIKTGTFTDGLLTLNINSAVAGIYVVRVMNKFGIVYTEKVIKW